MHLLHIIAEGLVVIAAIYMGVRTGGIGLGIWGLVGLMVMVFILHVPPASPPVDAVFIVFTVIATASVMQAAGGVDWMVRQAAKLIAGNPKAVTYLSPFAAFIFTVGAGTGNIFYPLLPVIYGVSYQQKIRPERPLAAAAVASQVGILCSPVSAATASLSTLLDPHGFGLGKILTVMWPACIIGVLVMSFVCSKMGKSLEKDHEYQRRLAAGEIEEPPKVDLSTPLPAAARNAALIFFGGVIFIVFAGLFKELRPYLGTGDSAARVSIAYTTEMVMGVVAGLIFLVCKPKAGDVPKQSTFGAGMVGGFALFGIAWLASTFVSANSKDITSTLGHIVNDQKWLFAVALALVAMLTTSQSSATNAIVPIGLSLSLSPALITAMWPAAMGIYILPANGSQIATVGFDQTGTTRIGKFVVNHSFQIPNLVFMVVAILVGFLMAAIV